MSRDFQHETAFFNEQHRREPTCEPDYDAIDRNVFGVDDVTLDGASTEARELAVRMMIRLKSWDFQDGLKYKEGLMIRSAVSAWAVVPDIRLFTLTQLSLGLGLEKQSLGRWVDRFKRDFPLIRNDHMRT
jgi:hypothetical protein